MFSFQINTWAKKLLLLFVMFFSACTKPAVQSIKAVEDPHSKAIIAQARVTHLEWDAFVDVANRTIEATEVLTINQVQKSEELILDTKDLLIKNIFIASANRAFVPTDSWNLGTRDAILGQALKLKIRPDTRFVKIEYSVGAAAEGLLYMDAEQTLTGKPFLFSQSESLFARSWLALQDAPQVRFTFSARVRLPKGDSSLVLMSSPNNPKKVNANGIYEFRQNHPIPSYLMSLTVGPLQYASLGKRTGFYAESPWLDKATKDLSSVEEMLATAEKCFGPYPWERYDVLVLPERFPFGGMENPCITYASGTIITGDKSLVNVVIHEICHSWFGNMVTHCNWADISLSEGFTEWGELTINRMLNGDDIGDMLWINEITLLEDELSSYKPAQTKLYRHMKDPEELFDYVPYNKGAMLLETTKNLLGLERTLKLLRTYLNKFAWSYASVSSFIDFLKEQLSREEYAKLQAEAWFYQPGLPTNRPTFISATFTAVEKGLNDWKNGKELQASSWNTQQWVHFLDLIFEKGATSDQLHQLEQTYSLAQKNSEIQMRFYMAAIKGDFEEAFPAMEIFLMKVGRKKLIIPIYKELCNKGKPEYAKRLIKKANYHPITQTAIEANVPCAKD